MRSWLPLLFIPTNASPIFIFLFFSCTYFLNRPCIYCSLLLLILFASSCQWADQCFFDFGSNWFQPRHISYNTPVNGTNVTAAIYADALQSTASALTGAALEEAKLRLAQKAEWTGIGVEWLRSLLGKREWRIPHMDVYVRLWTSYEKKYGIVMLCKDVKFCREASDSRTKSWATNNRIVQQDHRGLGNGVFRFLSGRANWNTLHLQALNIVVSKLTQWDFSLSGLSMCLYF